MTLVGNSFLKVVQTVVNSGDISAGYVARTYTARVEDTTTMAIYYNGQEIPNTITPGSKYYYTAVATLNPSNMSSYFSGNIVPTDTSSIVITVSMNPSYVAPGYLNSSGGMASFDGTTHLMTLNTAPTTGSVSINSEVIASGITSGTTITGLNSGTLNVAGSTYTLSIPPTTIANESIATGTTNALTSAISLSLSDLVIFQYYYIVYMVAA